MLALLCKAYLFLNKTFLGSNVPLSPLFQFFLTPLDLPRESVVSPTLKIYLGVKGSFTGRQLCLLSTITKHSLQVDVY